jgi:RNA polymerase sigma-70 factor (ECF subfamily)
VGNDVTRLLERIRSGDSSALEQLTPLVYDHLHRIASSYMHGERPGHTMQATSLVNEAWIRLAASENPDYKSRAHFFGFAARLMRQILVDHARSTNATKRNAGIKVQLPEYLDATVPPQSDPEILALNAALERMAAENETRARLVEMRYFSGMNLEEIAEVLNTSISTIHRELRVAQAWLKRELTA